MGGIHIDGVPLHARDHLPDGPDPIDFPASEAEEMALAYVMGIDGSDFEVTSGFYGWTRIGNAGEDYLEGYTNPAAEQTLPGADAQMLTPDLTRGSIHLSTASGRVPVFMVHFHVKFFTSAGWTGHVGIRLNTDSIGVTPLDEEPELVQPAPASAGTYPLTHTAGPLICFGPPAGGLPREFFIRAFQDSGSTRDFMDPVIVIQQTGWFDGDTGTFLP